MEKNTSITEIKQAKAIARKFGATFERDEDAQHDLGGDQWVTTSEMSRADCLALEAELEVAGLPASTNNTFVWVITHNYAYYIVCDANGPVSHKLHAATTDSAVAEFEGMSAERLRNLIDGASTDIEDDLTICGDDMDESDFSNLLTENRAEMVRDLSEIDNAHAGTVAHLAGGWRLWRVVER